jgi:hypothetical protein
MIEQPPALKDCNLEQSTVISLKREPACFAFLCSDSVSPPLPIDSINLDLASADYFGGRASLWASLEIRSGTNDDRPTAVLGFDESFLRPFTRALIEAASTRLAYRMTIVGDAGNETRFRVVEYVTGPGIALRQLILTPHDNVVLVGAGTNGSEATETLFQLPRTDSFLRSFAKMAHQADQMLRDIIGNMERLGRHRLQATG